MLSKSNETNSFSQSKIKRVIYGQHGCYQFLFELSPVSHDLQLAVICCEHEKEKFPHKGYYLLLHHKQPHLLKNVKVTLQSSKLRDQFQYVERLKVNAEGTEPQYFVALTIGNSSEKGAEIVKEEIQKIINEVAILMRRTNTFVEPEFSFCD